FARVAPVIEIEPRDGREPRRIGAQATLWAEDPGIRPRNIMFEIAGVGRLREPHRARRHLTLKVVELRDPRTVRIPLGVFDARAIERRRAGREFRPTRRPIVATLDAEGVEHQALHQFVETLMGRRFHHGAGDDEAEIGIREISTWWCLTPMRWILKLGAHR